MAEEVKKVRRDAKLSKLLREKLGASAEMQFQDVNAMAEGYAGKTNGEVIADKIIGEACRGERWAIEIIADRTEGKPIQAIRTDDGDRQVEQRLSDVTRKHLNALATALGNSDARDKDSGKQTGADAAGERAGDDFSAESAAPAVGPRDGQQDPGPIPPAATPGFLDLPRDGDFDS